MKINIAAFRKERRIPDVTLETVESFLDQPDRFVIVTVRDPGPDQMKHLQACFNLHDLAVEDASSAHQRPKLESYGATLFMALHTAKQTVDKIVYGELHLFISERFVILIQHGGFIRYDTVVDRIEANPSLFSNGSGSVVYAVLDYLVDQFMFIAIHLQEQLDLLESQIFANKIDSTEIESLYALKRRVAKLHNAVAPVGDICSELLRLHPELVPTDLHPYFRDVQDHVQRTTRNTMMLREALSDALQVNLALITIRQNEVVKRLAGWGAILAVPTMFFSMYGTNFKYMPVYDWKLGYPVAMLLTAFICREVYRKLKSAGWL